MCIFADWQFFLELIWEPVTFPVVCVSDSDCNIAVPAKHVTKPLLLRQLRRSKGVLEASSEVGVGERQPTDSMGSVMRVILKCPHLSQLGERVIIQIIWAGPPSRVCGLETTPLHPASVSESPGKRNG